MYDLRAWAARLARSSGVSEPSGSTCRSNRARKAAVPAVVDVPPWAWSAWAPARARSDRSAGDSNEHGPFRLDPSGVRAGWGGSSGRAPVLELFG